MSPRRAAALRNSQGAANLREHLIATAERMIATGADTLTVRAVAAEARVADGVLYNYFADKEELLALALHAHVRTVEAGLGPLPEPGRGTLEENLRTHVTYGLALHRRCLPAFTRTLGQPKVLARFAAIDVPGQPWRDRLVEYLRAERDQGRLRADARVDAAAAMIVGVCHEVVLSVMFSVGEPPQPPDVDDLVTAVLHGLL
ncbi:TetR/AcrR family transcriptional regulator [Cryptosporangium minutisporangium]|uniref:TetR/AcrR family transcriptional regulator n=1 Tax=Cryptosporangium minutisporangium TaxID=113569 RepID=A0ABP6SXX8_9ACTN